jgi:SAM-dependent methyltransferase
LSYGGANQTRRGWAASRSGITIVDRKPVVSASGEMRRDRALEADLVEAITANRNLDDLSGIRLWVDGAVAHIEGTVRNEAELQTLRRTTRLVRGLYAVWDLVAVPGKALTVADVGCGGYKQVREAIGVDRYTYKGVELVADLEHGTPFSSDSVDHIFAVHILEHVNNLLALMNDLHRVLRETGILHVMVPYWRHSVAVADPTHVRFFVPQSFRTFCRASNTVKPFRPLLVSCNRDTVFADLLPDKRGKGARDDEMVRFFL